MGDVGTTKKTTVELPEELLREAKATAARRGEPLNKFLREAVSEKLAREGLPLGGVGSARTWPVPPLPLGPEESALIDAAIEEAFERIDTEE
jgi:hypothetical protein